MSGKKGMTSPKRECKLCGKIFGHLAKHVRVTHKTDWVTYQVEQDHGGVWPVCRCGKCGQRVSLDKSGHLNIYIQGHENVGRKNSLSSNELRREASSANLKKRWQDDPVRMQLLAARGTQAIKENYTPKQWSDVISFAITRLYLSGGVQWCRGSYFHSGKSVRVRNNFRSSYEHLHMVALDDDPTVISWHYEPCSISYEWENKTRRYIPDFMITYTDGRRELQEVGVGRVKESQRNQAKFEAARRYCESLENTAFRLVTEQDHPEWVKA